MSKFTTIKAAEVAGFHRIKPWEYGGQQITVKGVLLVRRPKTAQSETAWRREGRKVVPGTVPHAVRTVRVASSKAVTYGVYRLDQTIVMRRTLQRRSATAHPPTAANILAAIFSVNRSAKRYRDAAQTCYRAGVHGFAKSHRTRKESLYELKDRGLMYAYRSESIVAVGLHGDLTVYRGNGYCFHSPLRPEDVELPTICESVLFVEAKPRRASDMPLRDAQATLEQLPDDDDGYVRVLRPRRVRSHEPYLEDEDDDFDDIPY